MIFLDNHYVFFQFMAFRDELLSLGYKTIVCHYFTQKNFSYLYVIFMYLCCLT